MSERCQVVKKDHRALREKMLILVHTGFGAVAKLSLRS